MTRPVLQRVYIEKELNNFHLVQLIQHAWCMRIELPKCARDENLFFAEQEG